jgi:glycine cleavage system H protein
MNPEDLLYSKEHEWIRIENGTGTIGITHYAQDELGDVVFVEFPQVGTKVEAGKPLGTIESVKAVSEIFSPVSGEVLEVNKALENAPESVNKDPYGAGWLVRVRVDKGPGPEMMSAKQYTEYIGG